MINIDNLKVNIESQVFKNKNIVIVPHKFADFDAIGSAIGLSLLVKKMKRIPFIVVDDRFYDLDRKVQSLIKETKKEFCIVNSRELPKDNRYFILTDVNKKYMTTVSDLIPTPEDVTIIDHHESDENTLESNYKFIDPQVSSASEVVSKLLIKMKVKIPPNVANYLLTGIYLDTKKLTKNVSSDTYYIAGKLAEYGADINYVTELLSEDFETDRKIQDLISKTKMITYKIAMIIANDEEEYNRKELAKSADYALDYGVDASFAIGKLDHNMIGVSARSKDKIDVGKVMHEIAGSSGGGNPFSAAANIKDQTPEEIGKGIELLLRPNYYNKQIKR